MSKSMISRIASVFFSRVLSRAAQFVAFMLLARFLSPEEFGWYGLFTTSILLFTTLGSLGLRQSSAYWLGQKLELPGRLTANLLLLLPALSVITTLVLMVVVGRNVPGGGMMFITGVTLAATLGAMSVMIMLGVLLGQGQMTRFAVAGSVMPVALLVLVVALRAADMLDFTNALVAVAISQVFAGILAILIVWPQTPPTAPAVRQMIPMIRHGLAFTLNVFLVLLSTRISIYLIEHLLDATSAGQFFAGQRLSDMLGEVAMATGLVLFSDTARAKDPAEVMRKSVGVAAWIFWMFALASIAIIVFAEPITLLVFGAAYSASASILAISAVAIAPSVATKIIYPVLAARGKPIWATIPILISITINISLSLYLVPIYGIDGGAWALVVSQFILLIGYALVLKRCYDIPVSAVFLPRKIGR